MTVAALEVRELAAPFGAARGIERLSLRVAPGERIALLGRSGAGKTTLLRALAGLQPITAGSIHVRGTDVTSTPPERRDITYLHQTPLLFPHLDVFENVAFPLRVRAVAEGEIRARVEAILASVHLPGYGPRAPRTLSGGQRHRVALARAMVARPAVLLLDEPLSSLDPELRQEVREVLIELQSAYGPALVMVTHDLDDAAIVGQRIGVLADRTLVQLDTPADLFSRPATVGIARLLGMTNVVPGVVAGGTFMSALGAWPSPLADGPATAACRADGLILDPSGEVEGVVIGVHVRPDRCTARVRVGTEVVEVLVGPGSGPAAGTPVRLRVCGGRLRWFAAGTSDAAAPTP